MTNNTWRKNPVDHSWEKDANPTTDADRHHPTTNNPSSSSVPPSSPARSDGGSKMDTGLNDNDNVSQITFDHHDLGDDDPKAMENQTLNSRDSALTATSNYQRWKAGVTNVLHDTVQIWQGIPPKHPNDDHDKINMDPTDMTIHLANGNDENTAIDPNQRSEKDLASSSPPTLDFLQDDVKQMTRARRMALTLMKHGWYYHPIGPEETEVEVEEEDGRNSRRITSGQDLIKPVGGSPPPATKPREPPTVTAKEYPSLAKAWAYFEHVTLPRHFFDPNKTPKKKKNVIVRMFRRVFCKGDQALDRAEPGENTLHTKLYDPLFTPLKQMGDFGLGIGLYFSTLRAMMILTLLAGLINIPNFIFFSGPHYNAVNQQDNIPKLLQGSAICSAPNQIWVPCPNCTTTTIDATTNMTSIHSNIPFSRLANATIQVLNTSSSQQNNVTFALRNFCFGATLQQGFVNYGTLCFFVFGILLLNYYLQHMEVKFDEDEQTAQDYSIVITNPPPDATDPDEWKSFFETNFVGCHVTVCTVAVDNDLLVRSLVQRREAMKRIEMMVDPGTSLNDISLSNIAAKTERERRWYHRIWAHWCAPGIPEYYGRAVVLTAKIQGLAQQEYPAANVFVSFETEAGQRTVLSTLSVGGLAVRRNDTHKLPDPRFLFRSQHVLSVEEAEEPNTIRWEDLNAPYLDRCKEVFWTSVATIAAIVLIAFIVQVVNHTSPVFAAFAISIFNAIFPAFAKILTSLEAHPTEGHKQTSLYFKIALFRWVNTAVVYTIIRPFTSTLDQSGGIIPSIYAQFFAEIITSNVIQLADPFGHIQRHFLAPRAKTQDAMNMNMQGQPFDLAERYTNMTKILFLALWYCAIYPAAFFMCSFALLVIFFVDRYSLFRTWKPAPHLGTIISRFSRNYFFSLAVVAMAVISSYYWSAFPFDNLCQSSPTSSVINSLIPINSTNSNVRWQLVGLQRFNAEEPFNSSDIPSITDTEYTYRYCLQDLIRSHRRKSFPFTSMSQPSDNEWMTPSQETVTNVYGWTSVGVIVLVLLSFLWLWWDSLQGLFRSSYNPCGEDQGINFSDVPSMNTYIPQVASPVFGYPLLATNITGLDTSLLDWTDPDREFEFYDLTKDAERLLRGKDISSKVVFSQVKHWPPQPSPELDDVPKE